MLRRFLIVGALVATGALAACEDSTAPEGATSNATVHAYVDADGTGNISAGDVFISGVTITLTSTDAGITETATTDASGVARFPTLRAGSYVVTMSGGNVPEGAVLATSTSPVLVAPFRGDEVAQEFRFVFNPGSIEGRLFRDDNGNDVYDPGIDTPAPGIPVTLFAGAAATGEAVAVTTTDAEGAFSFTTLRPGTYTYSFEPLPTMTLPAGVAQTVTVGAQASTAAAVEFTGNLISTIAEARALAKGTGVAVVGVVTVGNGVLNDRQFFVQDATGGILVFGTVTPGTQIGDSVRVVGEIDIFSGELEIVAPAGGTLSVERLGTGTVPAPRLQTLDQVLTNETQGQLVFVPNVEVVSVSGIATSTAYNVVVEDADGHEMTIRVAGSGTGIPQPSWQVGRSYDVTGLVSAFNTVAQLKPRSLDDVEIRSAGIPIGQLRAQAFADSANMRFDTVTVEGVVHTAQGTFRNDNAFIQDATGGILLFNVPSSADLEVGDSVRVTAAIDWFNGELELVRFSSTSPPIIEKLGTAATPQPRTVSGAQFVSRAFEGQLVRLANAVVDSVGNPSSSGGYTVWVIAQDGERVQVRIENNSIGIPTTEWTIGEVVDVVGALSSFRGTSQVKPRGAADVTPGTAGVMSIAEARAVALDEAVIVEGVVIVGQGTYRTDNIYIQDPTGGLQVFGIDPAMELEVGELVRVSGTMDAFNDERQITDDVAPLVVTRIGFGAVPQPRTLTGAEVLANTFEGQLATVTDVEVVSVGSVSSSSGAYNVTMLAPDGTTFTVRIENRAVGIDAGFFVVGGRYDVTGALGSFRGSGQLKPRMPGDVVRR